MYFFSLNLTKFTNFGKIHQIFDITKLIEKKSPTFDDLKLVFDYI